MGLLTICAQHYEGLAWLVSFYLLLNLMPHLSRLFGANKNSLLKAEPSFTRGSLVQHGAFVLFVASILYAGGTLPCGRFYYEAVEGFFGNSVLKLSYQYVYLYMGVLVHVLDISERWITSLPTIKRTLALVIAFLKDEAEVETFEEEKKENKKSDEEGSTGESGE